MKRTIFWGATMGLLFIFTGSPMVEAAWQSAIQNLNRPMEHVLFTNSPSGQVLLAAGEGRIWRRLGEEVAAQEVLLLPVGEEKVFDLYAAAEGDMYAATQGGLWQSTDAGVTWKEIFVINAETQGEALSVLRVGAEIWLGTGRGIFCLKPGGHWEKLSHLVNAERVAHLAQDARAVYWATSSTLFRFEKNTGGVSTLF